MMRFIISIILIGIAVTSFFVFTKPIYENIVVLNKEADSYDQALSNSKALENERDKLTSKFNSINKDDLNKLQKLLPDNIDNIRLILEIEKIASPYGMVLKDVKYTTTSETEKNIGAALAGTEGPSLQPGKQADYRTLNMDFSVSSNYDNFIKFTKDLESNLRIVDVTSVAFIADGDSKTNPQEIYKYSFKIKTYWFKN